MSMMSRILSAFNMYCLLVRCKLPDQSAKDSFKCACNDWAFQIAATRQPDTWKEQGFWCSTTMTMMNFDGSTKYVYNPYSLSELQAILAAVQPSGLTLLDEYLKCVADGGTCNPPSNNVFDRQQVMQRDVHEQRQRVPGCVEVGRMYTSGFLSFRFTFAILCFTFRQIT